MIQKYVNRFMKRKGWLESQLKQGHPKDYKALVKLVVQMIREEAYIPDIDPELIYEIDNNDDGGQGTLLFIIAAEDWLSDDYWYVRIAYGSCCSCDTLQAIESDDPEAILPTDGQVKDYMTLALHIVQGLKKMVGEAV